MILILLPIYKSSGSFSKSLGIVPSAPITICIAVTFMFHNFPSSPARSNYSLSAFFDFPLRGLLGWLLIVGIMYGNLLSFLLRCGKKAIWKGNPMRLEPTRVGLLAELANHYTTTGTFGNVCMTYKFDQARNSHRKINKIFLECDLRTREKD